MLYLVWVCFWNRFLRFDSNNIAMVSQLFADIFISYRLILLISNQKSNCNGCSIGMKIVFTLYIKSNTWANFKWNMENSKEEILKTVAKLWCVHLHSKKNVVWWTDVIHRHYINSIKFQMIEIHVDWIHWLHLIHADNHKQENGKYCYRFYFNWNKYEF